MTKPLLLLSLIAALGAGPAFAQSDDAPAADPATDAPATEPAADPAADPASEPAADPAPSTNIGGGLDLGEEGAEAPAGQQGPRTYIKETFNDWSLQCIEVPEGDDVCQMYQLLKDANGASVAEASIFKLSNGGRAVAGGTFVVPLETLLTQKLTVQVDNGAERRFDFSFCAQVGCYARVGFTAEDIQRFKAGAKAVVTIVPALAPDQKVSVEMSLSGFTAAYDASSALSQ
ncbi:MULTISPECIES: invasion associated locus B family protein [Ponticoccus]|uniref:Invasion associated locus B family protein n=1 Tax=Ponticoccus litoralis TaxID=422297 RepID=A0AAW9SFP4_9RHOB